MLSSTPTDAMAPSASHSADASKTGFLDLSAELRNKIYHEALVHDRRNEQTASVALLCTCKQIHKEANPVFAYNSTASLKVDFAHQERYEDLDLTVRGEQNDVVYRSTKPSAIDLLESLKSSGPKARNLSISIHHSIPEGRSHRWMNAPHGDTVNKDQLAPATTFLYALSSFVNSTAAIETLQIAISGRFKTFQWLREEPADVFWPLKRMHPRINIILDGFDSTMMAGLVPALQTRRAPTTDYLARFKSLEQRFSSLTEVTSDGCDKKLLDLAGRKLKYAKSTIEENRTLFISPYTPQEVDEQCFIVELLIQAIGMSGAGRKEHHRKWLKQFHDMLEPQFKETAWNYMYCSFEASKPQELLAMVEEMSGSAIKGPQKWNWWDKRDDWINDL